MSFLKCRFWRWSFFARCNDEVGLEALHYRGILKKPNVEALHLVRRRSHPTKHVDLKRLEVIELLNQELCEVLEVDAAAHDWHRHTNARGPNDPRAVSRNVEEGLLVRVDPFVLAEVDEEVLVVEEVLVDVLVVEVWIAL